MAFDEGLAIRIREMIAGQEGHTEKKMFGGLCFMLYGNMAAGVAGDDLMVRVGKNGYEDALNEPHCREMDITGKPLTGLVFIDPEGIEDDEDLRRWLDKGCAFAASLPPK